MSFLGRAGEYREDPREKKPPISSFWDANMRSFRESNGILKTIFSKKMNLQTRS